MIGTLFASRLIDPELAPRAIDLAFRLYMLPQGIFSVAVATVLFPTLSRLAARADHGGFARTLDAGHPPDRVPARSPRGSSPRSLAEPITRLVYERGEFTPDQTPVVAGALAAFAVGLVFNGWMLLLNRAFYGLQSNWIPTFVALGNLALNVALFAAFYPLGVWGLPLATSLSNLAGAVVLFALMQRRGIGLERGPTLTAMAGSSSRPSPRPASPTLVWWGLDEALGRSLLAQIVSLGTGLAVGTAVYLGACRVLGVRELGSLFALRRGAG